jgi:hypothetical protein
MPDQVKVPKVAGLPLAEARTKLADAGLVVGEVTRPSDATVPEGTAIRTDPPADATADKGSTVRLFVSSGPPEVAVPNLIGLTQAAAEDALKKADLRFVVTTAVNASVSAGKVSSSGPAAGTPVRSGSTVNVEVSSGPPQIAVPNLVGLSQSAAEAALKGAGLAIGVVTKVTSDSVSGAHPAAGTLVSPGSAVELEVSRPSWTQYIVSFIFGALGLAILIFIGAGIYEGGGKSFLEGLADRSVARGLITFLIAIATVGIAVILAISTIVLQEGNESDKRFDRGKQVLTILIGVLGTIVGFYFASTTDQQLPPGQEQAAEVSLPSGTVGVAYKSGPIPVAGLTPPLKWSVSPDLPADLVLDPPTGAISGTPKAPDSSTRYTFTVTDNASPPGSATAVRTLEIKQ